MPADIKGQLLLIAKCSIMYNGVNRALDSQLTAPPKPSFNVISAVFIYHQG